MKTFEIFWKDLKLEAQERLFREGLEYNGNWDIFPITGLYQEPEREDFDINTMIVS